MPGPPILTMRGPLRWYRFFENRKKGEWFVVTSTTRRQTPYQLRVKLIDGTYELPNGGAFDLEVACDEETGEWVLWARKL